jgi:hypothetical protein
MLVDRSFLNATIVPDLSFATLEPTPNITPRVIAALPKPDVKLDAECPPIKYIHRSLKDGEVYFLFNESAEAQTRTATLAGNGQVQVWDAGDGTVHPLAGVAKADGTVAVPLTLMPHESRFIVIGTVPPTAAQPWPTISTSTMVADLNGDWSVQLGDNPQKTALKPWSELGVDSFNGIAEYHKSISMAATPQGQRIYLDLGDLNDVARVRVNGKELEARSWAPYVWDVTDAVKSGDNAIDVQVQVAMLGGGRGGGGGGGGGGRGGRGGRGAAAGAPTTNPAAVGAAAAAPAVAHGLLGPVRLIAQ